MPHVSRHDSHASKPPRDAVYQLRRVVHHLTKQPRQGETQHENHDHDLGNGGHGLFLDLRYRLEQADNEAHDHARDEHGAEIKRLIQMASRPRPMASSVRESGDMSGRKDEG